MKDKKPTRYWTASDGNSFQADIYLNDQDKTITFKLFDCGATEIITTGYADFIKKEPHKYYNTYLGANALKDIISIIKEKT